MLPWWCLGSWSARRPDGESWWGEVVLPRAVPCLGTGDSTANTKMSWRGTISLGQRKRRQRHKGVGFLLFFSLVEYNVMNSVQGPAPPFNILSAEQGFLWQPGEPGEP